MNKVLGVDGCPDGWVGAAWDGEKLTLHHARSLADLHTAAGRPQTVAVDMPIGLLTTGLRRADQAAREFLGARRSSVFHPPVQAVLEAGNFDDYAAANTLNRLHDGRGLSRQSFALLRKIAEVEAWRHTADADVHEVHPEVAFQLLAKNPLHANKKTWTGANERRALLAQAGLQPDETTDLGAAAVDDVLDACVLAWSATRIAASRHRTFPSDPAPTEPTIRA